MDIEQEEQPLLEITEAEQVRDGALPDEEDEVQPDEEGSHNDEFYERHEIVADPKQALIRLDKFLMDRLGNRCRFSPEAISPPS